MAVVQDGGRRRDEKVMRKLRAQLHDLLAQAENEQDNGGTGTGKAAASAGRAAGKAQPSGNQSGEQETMSAQAQQHARDGGFEVLVSEQLARITDQLAALGRRLDEERAFAPQRPEEVPGYAELKTALYNLVEHLELAEGRTAEAISGLRDRLEEVAERTSRALQLAQQEGRVDDEALHVLQQRIETLNERMQRLEEAPPAAPDREQLTQLVSEELDQQLASRTQQTEQRMAAMVSRLQEKLEELAGGVMDIDRLRTDVERVEAQLQEVGAQVQQCASVQQVERIEASLRDLSARVEEKADRADIDTLRQRLDEMAERLQQARAAATPVDDARIRALEEQALQLRALVENELGESLVLMGERLAAHDERLQALAQQPSAPAAADEERLQRLEQAIATLQQAVEKQEAQAVSPAAAPEAAEEAVREIAVLKDGLQDLERMARETDRHTREMLTTMQEALAEVVERLVALEEAPRASAGSTHAAGVQDGVSAAMASAAMASAATEKEPENLSAQTLLAEVAPDTTATPAPQVARQAASPQQQGKASGKDMAAEVAAAIAGLEPGQDAPVPADDKPQVSAMAGADNGIHDAAGMMSATIAPAAPSAGSSAAGPDAGPATDDFIAAARRAALAASAEPAGISSKQKKEGAPSSLFGRLFGRKPAAAEEGKAEHGKTQPAAAPATAGDADEASSVRSLFGGLKRRGKSANDAVADTADAAGSMPARAAGGSRKRLLLVGLVMLSAAAVLLMRQQQAPKPAAQPAAVQQQAEQAGRQADDAAQPSQESAIRIPRKEKASGSGEEEQGKRQSFNAAPGSTGLFAPATGTPIHTASLSAIGAAGNGAAATSTGAAAAQGMPSTAKADVNGAAAGNDAADNAARSASLAPLPEGLGPAALRNAAINGDGKAAYIIALRYLKGEGVKRDIEAGVRWLRTAAEKGVVVAMYRLGLMHERGLGLPRDLMQARIWYERAALRGNVRAMHNLAVLLASGRLQEADAEKAAYWFRKAATHGVRDSQFNLAVLYHRGDGVPRSLADAWFWYSAAAAQGDSAAAEQARKLAEYLPPAQLAEMRRKFAAFTPTPPIRNANTVIIDRPEWRGGTSRLSNAAATAGAAAATQAAADMPQGKALVKEVQRLLKRIGYDVGPVDGIMGNRTANAIRLFQLQSRLPVNGTPDHALLQRLRQHVGDA